MLTPHLHLLQTGKAMHAHTPPSDLLVTIHTGWALHKGEGGSPQPTPNPNKNKTDCRLQSLQLQGARVTAPANTRLPLRRFGFTLSGLVDPLFKREADSLQPRDRPPPHLGTDSSQTQKPTIMRPREADCHEYRRHPLARRLAPGALPYLTNAALALCLVPLPLLLRRRERESIRAMAAS
jgi:hypothetical protein